MAHPIIGSKYCEIRVMFYIRLSNDEEKKSYFSSCPFWHIVNKNILNKKKIREGKNDKKVHTQAV